MWAGSAMVAARERLDIATGNLANASTDGFEGFTARGALTPVGVTIQREPRQTHGALRRTGRDLDLAIVGDGAFAVRDSAGHVTHVRNGAFTRERDGTLSDTAGRALVGHDGKPLTFPPGGRFDETGAIVVGDRVVGRVSLPAGSSLHAGFLESSGVDAIAEMVGVLSAERSFETAEKVVSAIDRTREKSATDVARLK